MKIEILSKPKTEWQMLDPGTAVETEEGYICVVVDSGKAKRLVALTGHLGCQFPIHISPYCETKAVLFKVLGTISRIQIEEN